MQVLGQFREETEQTGNLEGSQSWKGTMRQKTELVEREEVGEVGEVMGTELYGQKVKQQIR